VVLSSGVASPKIWGAKNLGWVKMFDFGRITLFCLEKRLSKHKITIFSKTFWGTWPLWLLLAKPMALRIWLLRKWLL